jgi:hypothetical protein
LKPPKKVTDTLEHKKSRGLESTALLSVLSANRFIQAAHHWIPGAIENNGDDDGRQRKSISC